MGKIVALPDNASRHVNVATQALAEKNYVSAVAHLEKAYEEAPTYAVARLLVPALNGLKQPQEAAPYVSKFMTEFLANADDTKHLFDTLLALPDFRFAWAVAHHLPTAQQAAIAQRITSAEKAALKQQAGELQGLAKKLRHLGGFSAHEQEQVLQDIGRLPRTLLIDAAQPSLVDKDVHPAVRNSLLDALTAVGADQPVPVAGYRAVQPVTPSELPGVMNDPTLLAVLKAATTQSGDDDPELVQGTLDVMRFEVGYLYPFVEAEIPDPAAFAQAYLAKDKRVAANSYHDLFEWLSAQTARLMDMA